MPIPGSRIFHPKFNTHHRPVAVAGMPSVCDIIRPGQPPASRHDPTPEPVYLVRDWPCRIQQRTQPARAMQVDQPQNVRSYLVTLALEGLPDIPVGDRGAIVTNIRSRGPRGIDPDPSLQRRTLRVVDAQYGSVMWERDLICEDNLTQNNPEVVDDDAGGFQWTAPAGR